MKILSTISFIILIGLTYLTQTTLSQKQQKSQKCIEFTRPIYRYKTVMVDCPMVTTNDKRQAPVTSDNMFTVDFNCLVDDTVLCNKVRNVFITAGKFITATLNLKSIIIVNATLANLCELYGCNGTGILGSATPTRLIPYISSDNKARFYPQALFKQMNLPEHPEFAPNDIMALFNSDTSY